MDIFLETDRLRLRRAAPDDASLLFTMDSDPDVIRYTDLGGCRPLEFYRETLLPRWLRYYEEYEGRGCWVAEEKATNGFLGWFHFRPAREAPEETELGYRLQKSAWGNGYATEIARALVTRGFDDLGATRITATALAANRASIRVMEKAGLQFETNYLYEFIDPSTGQATEHSAVKYGLNKEAAAKKASDEVRPPLMKD